MVAKDFQVLGGPHQRPQALSSSPPLVSAAENACAFGEGLIFRMSNVQNPSDIP